MTLSVARWIAIVLFLMPAFDTFADGTYNEKLDGDAHRRRATPLPFDFPNPNTLWGSVGGRNGRRVDNRDTYSFNVGDDQTVEAINITTNRYRGGGRLRVLLDDDLGNRLVSERFGKNVTDYDLLQNQPLAPGDYTLILRTQGFYGYAFDFIYGARFSTAELVGSASQVQIQGSSHQFQLLSNQIHNIVNGINVGGLGGVNGFAAAPPSSSSSHDDVQLVSYEEGVELTSYQTSRNVRGRTHQGSPVAHGWNGWIHGYGIGGQVDTNNGVAGLDYGAGGTQLGLYRMTSNGTLIGLFGAYGNQNVETTDGSIADINSGIIGSFLRRGDHEGNYYVLAGSVAIDDYETSRPVGVQGEFDGVQTGVYLERGWTRCLSGITAQPNVALQYIWVHQDDHVETGTGGASVDDVDAHSLRTLVGSTFQVHDLAKCKGGWLWTPNARANWMHEYLDRATSVTGSLGGASFAAEGLDLGRDWAVLGFGTTGRRDRAVTLYANYDLQINDRQSFHTGSGGFVWSR